MTTWSCFQKVFKSLLKQCKYQKVFQKVFQKGGRKCPQYGVDFSKGSTSTVQAPFWHHRRAAAGPAAGCTRASLGSPGGEFLLAQSTPRRDPKVFSDGWVEWGIVHFSAVSSRFIWIFHTFQIRTLAPRHSSRRHARGAWCMPVP